MTRLIFLDGSIVAVAGRASAYFVGEVAELDPGDPLRRRVALMCQFAHAIDVGELPGPYDDQRAEAYATAALKQLSGAR